MVAGDTTTRRLGVAARVFAFVALGTPMLWTKDVVGLTLLLLLGMVLLAGLTTELVPRWLAGWTVIAEAALVGLVVAVSLDTTLGLAGAVAVPPFLAGLRRGVLGLALALCAQLVPVAVATALTQRDPDPGTGFLLFSWFAMGVGLGMIASFLHATLQRRPDSLNAYRYARRLITRLLDLSGGLDSGLDPQVLGGALLSRVGDAVAARSLVLLVPRSGECHELTPLVAVHTSGEADAPETDLDALAEVAERARHQGAPVLQDDRFAFPLVADGDTTVGVVAGLLPSPAGTGLLEESRLVRLLPDLTAAAVQLETALLFRAFRDSATAEERRRLAREMHDGVAQDIASLGYLVDALAARPTSPDQAEQLDALRRRITSVVGEVRRSVEILRTDVGASESLGAAIATLARNLSAASGIPIQVTSDEPTTRLRPEVEAELFRIVQEALNNAVRHAHASRIDVHCQVQPPRAVITVADDGRGLQEARRDSYGLKIMRERADLLHAALEIDNRDTGGLVVSVRLPALSADPARHAGSGDTVSA